MGPHSSILLWRDIYEIADKVCLQFGLRYGKILPETRKRARCYGEAAPCDKCYNNPNIDERNCNEKILRIRLHHLNKNNKPLACSTIIKTLAHELAHLREWNHGTAHRAFEAEIMDFIRDMGYLL